MNLSCAHVSTAMAFALGPRLALAITLVLTPPTFLPGVVLPLGPGLAFFLPPAPPPCFLGADLIIASRDWSISMVDTCEDEWLHT